MKVIQLNLRCGLCNRLQTIFFHYTKIKKYKKLLIVWNIDKNNSHGNFYDFFAKINHLEFVKETKLKVNYKGNGSDLKVQNNNYKSLKLLPYMNDIIKNEKNKLNNNYIAIHVRRTDIINLYKKKNIKFINNYDKYDKFIESYPEKNLYIATDNQESYNYFYHKYKDNRILNTNIKFLKTKKKRKTSMKDTIIDLYMCINANKFLGTELSSFTRFIYHNRKNIIKL
jgi:hypothetical protein